MYACKAFYKGLICRGYQFKMGLNVTEKANCRANGFHCAENPLDCLNHYSDNSGTEFYLVNAGGDIDETDGDSQIACTELTILRRLTRTEYYLFGLAFMAKYPLREWSRCVSKNRAAIYGGAAIVRGRDPVACGNRGDILAFAKENDNGEIVQIAVTQVDGKNILPGHWYDVDLKERLDAKKEGAKAA